MSFAIIIRGPAGAGKSEIASQLAQGLPNSIHLDIDKFKHVISKDSSQIRNVIAHDVGSFFLKQLIKNNFNVVIEEVFREDYYHKIIQIFKESNYPVVTIFLTASKETLLKRDKERVKNKGEKIITRIEKEIKPLNEDLIIDTTNKKIEEIKSIIIKKLYIDGLL